MANVGGQQTGKRALVYTSAYRGGASWFVLEMAAGMSAAGGDILLIAPRAEPECLIQKFLNSSNILRFGA